MTSRERPHSDRDTSIAATVDTTDEDLDDIEERYLNDLDDDESGLADPDRDDWSDKAVLSGVESPDELPVVYLHIGTFKAGTSYLQGRLADAAPGLSEDGVLFPGRAGYASQVGAARDALGWESGGRGRAQTSWSELRDEILAWRGAAAVVSMEFLSTAPRNTAARIVNSFRPADVRVIVTARDLMRVIPSSWQETTQNRKTRSWTEFIEGLTATEPSTRDAKFWANHDPAEVVNRWVDAVGADHVYVVTVPPSGAPENLLWQRFCSVLNVDPERYPAEPGAIRANASLDTASAELLRRINAALPESFTKPMYGKQVKKFLAKEVLVKRTGGTKPALPEQYRDWAVKRSRQIVTSLESSGAQIVGNLDELVPSESPDPARSRPDDVSEHDVADAAVHAIVALLTQRTPERGTKTERAGRGQRRRRPRATPA